MIEAFEPRQLFSVALNVAVPTTDSTPEQPTIVVDAAAAKTSGGKAAVHDVSFTHLTDSASAKLM